MSECLLFLSLYFINRKTSLIQLYYASVKGLVILLTRGTKPEEGSHDQS